MTVLEEPPRGYATADVGAEVDCTGLGQPQGRRAHWVVEQWWDHLLFAHWPIAPDLLRPLIPAPLEVDVADGFAWLSVVPFGMRGIRVRGTPPVPGISAFAEGNLRTYVRHKGKAGVYFLSLDADSILATAVARAIWHVPYFMAETQLTTDDGGVSRFTSRRHRNSVRTALRYQAKGSFAPNQAGTLAYWLSERYFMFAVRGRQLITGEIWHPPWQVAAAELEIERNELGLPFGLELKSKPVLAQVAASQCTQFYWPKWGWVG